MTIKHLTVIAESTIAAANSPWSGVPQLLPTIDALSAKELVSVCQIERLQRLVVRDVSLGDLPPLPDDLFVPPAITALGSRTCIISGANNDVYPAEKLWLQLLPNWVEQSEGFPVEGGRWAEQDLEGYRVYTLDKHVAHRLSECVARYRRFSASRGAQFARSANYMGSKSVLASQLVDILDTFENPDTVVLDLMCGSGVMAGAFAKSHRTFASDAQWFCRLLGLVQGGGMTHRRGLETAEKVVKMARQHFSQLSAGVIRRIEDEDRLLNSELTASMHESAFARMRERTVEWTRQHLGSLDAVTDAARRGELFSHLYAGVYFGERQAAELDCLRRAIDSIEDDSGRDWALGALVCAGSACAYTYGGHFAQPKLDISENGKIRGDLREALQQRSLSLTHEFFVRLSSLAQESEEIRHPVRLVEGPWQEAIEAVAVLAKGQRVCVYVDPPYTRDEYSRYYHVLEAIVRNVPQAVSGKGRLPARGSPGRFASPFSARRSDVAENEIADVLTGCLGRGWSCLWSYSNSGTASVAHTLELVADGAGAVEIFKMNHIYKAQGKRMAKHVSEYGVHLQPAKR